MTPKFVHQYLLWYCITCHHYGMSPHTWAPAQISHPPLPPPPTHFYIVPHSPTIEQYYFFRVLQEKDQRHDEMP